MMASEDVNLGLDQMVEVGCSTALASNEKKDVDVIQVIANLSPDDDNMETVSLDNEKTENAVDLPDPKLDPDTEELLTERDKLSAELTEKTIQLNAFETELSSLKSKVEALETEKGQILADHEKLHLQNETLNVKVNEVTVLLSLVITVNALGQHVQHLLAEKALHRCKQRKGVHGGEVCHR